jgi:hypothetical protein
MTHKLQAVLYPATAGAGVEWRGRRRRRCRLRYGWNRVAASVEEMTTTAGES